LAYELRTVLAESGECFVDVAHCEHSTQVAERVHRGVAVIGDRGEKTRELEAAVAIGRDQHGDLDALITQSSDASGPFSFNHGSPLKRQAKLGEKSDGIIEGFHVNLATRYQIPNIASRNSRHSAIMHGVAEFGVTRS
jgi:hypothetical protein